MTAPDQTVAETPTPRTDAYYGDWEHADKEFARTLERELAAANAALRDAPTFGIEGIPYLHWLDKHAKAIKAVR